ncbi:hypothetical protein Taro_026423 [Colocasia esculenta]|uniref:Uncharacterized protein n=1 Tax=Colocasia esculenta TaxID=4460 RepID=A0A843VRA4_COLES|nr:hypothetical protein [Colocasia esculenta]
MRKHATTSSCRDKKAGRDKPVATRQRVATRTLSRWDTGSRHDPYRDGHPGHDMVALDRGDAFFDIATRSVVATSDGRQTAGIPHPGVASFPAGSECVAAAVGGACCEHGCRFARAAIGFVVGLRVRVGVSVLLCLVLVEVRFPQNCVVLVSGCCGIALWVESSAVLPPWFEVFVVCLVAVALPSRLRCIAWLPCVLVRFPRTIGCCPGEVHSQDCSGSSDQWVAARLSGVPGEGPGGRVVTYTPGKRVKSSS